MGKVTIIVMLFALACVQGQFFEDRRCRCVCPSPASVLNISTTRQIYTGNVPPNKCHCEGVVFPIIGKELEGKVHLLCPRCDCSYQTRNTTLIMDFNRIAIALTGAIALLRTFLRPYTGVVFFMLTLIIMSVIYMVTLCWLNTWVAGVQRTNGARIHIEIHKSLNPEENSLLLSEDPEEQA